MRAQSTRLARLRRLVGMQKGDAADVAGVSRFSWYRMEEGKARIDAVALARFLAYRNLPAEYVISGGFLGLPPDLVRDLVRDEEHEAAAAAVSSEAPPVTSRAGKSARKSKASIAT